MNNTDLTGRTLGHYTVTDRLGRGGMADVYKAFHPQLEVYRAIKVIRPEFVTTTDFRDRFQKEAKAVAALRHPNIVQIHDFGEDNDAYFMVMEFIEGQDLKKLIKKEGSIRPISHAVDLIAQVAGALHYAHQRGLIHRDIKPENIMLSAEGQPILMDFGIAKLLTAQTQLTQTGMSIGTPAYMAPEQAQALPDIGPPADIYSLAVVLYEMLTGQVPFNADTPMAVMLKSINDPMPMPRELSRDISEDLQRVILKATAKDANDRYATAEEFQSALSAAIDTDHIATTVMPTNEKPKPPQRGAVSRGKAIAWGGALGLAAGLGVGWYIYFGPGEQNTEPNPRTLAVQEQPAMMVASPEADAPAAATETITASDASANLAANQPTQAPAIESAPAPDQARPVTPAAAGISPDGSTTGNDPTLEQQAATTSETRQTSTVATAADAAPAAMTVPATAPADAPDTAGEPVVDSDQSSTVATLQAQPEPRPDPVLIQAGTIGYDDIVRGSTQTPGERLAYQFPAQPGQRMFFDLTNNPANAKFILKAPDGDRLFATREDHGPVMLAQAGTYTLKVVPALNQTAAFAFELNARQYGGQIIKRQPITVGRYIQGRSRVPGQTLNYSFQANAGHTLYFDLTSSSANTYFTLTSPNNGVQVFSTAQDTGPFVLPESGTYTLAAEPPPDRTAGYEFKLWQLTPPVISGGRFEPGSIVRGATEAPGQRVTYAFLGNAGERVTFDRISVSQTTGFTLTAPNGQQVFEETGDVDPVVLPQTGLYTLVADPWDDHTASFEFVVRTGN